MEQINIARRDGAPQTVNAYPRGALAVHKSESGKRWLVTHKTSGYAITGGRSFDSKAQAVRYADELQKQLDFSLLKQGADMAWDVQKAFGSENIRKGMSAAFQEAYGS